MTTLSLLRWILTLLVLLSRLFLPDSLFFFPCTSRRHRFTSRISIFLDRIETGQAPRSDSNGTSERGDDTFGTFPSLFHFSLHREPRRNTHTIPAQEEPTIPSFGRSPLLLRWIPHTTTFFTLEEKFSFTREDRTLFTSDANPRWRRKCTFSRAPERRTLSNPPETEPPELAEFNGTALAGDFACQIALYPHGHNRQQVEPFA